MLLQLLQFVLGILYVNPNCEESHETSWRFRRRGCDLLKLDGEQAEASPWCDLVFTTVLLKWSFLQPWARTDSQPHNRHSRRPSGLWCSEHFCVLDESVHQCQWRECGQLSRWFPTFITEDSSPADLTLTRPVTLQAVVTASRFTAAVCREEAEWWGRERLSLQCVLTLRWTHPDHSGLHTSRADTSHRPSPQNLCDTDMLRFRWSRPHTARYRSRADLWARDTAHSAAQKTLHSTSAPGDGAER